MLHSTLLTAGAVIALTHTSPTIAVPGDTVPIQIQARIADMVGDCKASGGKPDTTDAVIKTDLDHDGLTDYIFWEGNVGCVGNEQLFAPTANAGLMAVIYAGDKDGTARRTWIDDNVWNLTFKNGTVTVSVAGPACDDFDIGKPGHQLVHCEHRVVVEKGIWKNVPVEGGVQPPTVSVPPPARRTAWGYGDTLPLVEPSRGPCPDVQLLKGYCFREAIGWLRRHPNEYKLRVLAVTAPVSVGMFIGRNAPVNAFWVEIRREGETFTAEKSWQGTTRVNPPQGCMSLRRDIAWTRDRAGGVPREPEFASAFLDGGDDLAGDVLVDVEAFHDLVPH